MSIEEKLITIAENEPKVYKAGQKAECNKFWEIYQDKGKRRNYANAFVGQGWSDETFNPKYDIVCSDNGYACMSYSLITDTKVNIDVSKSANSKNFFQASTLLKTIRKLFVSEKTVFTNMFSNCLSLENITIDGVIDADVSFGDCPKLTHESLISIINALKTFETVNTTERFEYGEYGGWNEFNNDFGDPKGITWNVNSATYEYGTLTLRCSNVEYYGTTHHCDFTIEGIPLNSEDVPYIKTFMADVMDYTETEWGMEFICDLVFTIEKSTGSGTLTLGETNLAKLSDEEKAIATNKGWELK